MELPKGKPQSRKEFWIHHIEAAERFDGTFKEYCEHHGLKPGSLNAYRKKLGYSKPRSVKSKPLPPTDFVPVKVSAPQGYLPKALNLPDPTWLAQFLKAWSQT